MKLINFLLINYLFQTNLIIIKSNINFNLINSKFQLINLYKCHNMICQKKCHNPICQKKF